MTDWLPDDPLSLAAVRAERACVFCGRPFTRIARRNSAAVTCSKACSTLHRAERRRRWHAAYNAKRRADPAYKAQHKTAKDSWRKRNPGYRSPSLGPRKYVRLVIERYRALMAELERLHACKSKRKP